ncbi:hypothetical protein SAMN02744787_0060 [Bacillus subtilis]|nr:hypothetical protein C7T97_16235 [Bacillus subtilis]PTN35097.1 hypothetical protein DAD79_04775 [Bacillus sp. Rc4]RMD52833.1 hypothetical protein D3Z89_20845 [Bacillus subtilis]CAF1888464.1 hypothetical protein NRS6185_02992 [Bacillus subtilis]SMF55512.1 hypothetical protein SAMN02744787_0060 [Bacillus subtilis]
MNHSLHSNTLAKIVCTVTLTTLYFYFFGTRFNELIELAVFALIGLFLGFYCFPIFKKFQISERFKQKSENARIVGMINFVLEQKYKKSISE